MKQAICLPIKFSNFEQGKRLLKKAEADNDVSFLELWLDEIEDVEGFFALNSLKKPFIIVNKNKDEMGNFKGTEDERVKKLLNCAKFKPWGIDIGIETPKNLIELTRNTSGYENLIISFHNFNKTPILADLTDIYNKMSVFKPNVVKFALFVERAEDIFVIFEFLKFLRDRKARFIFTVMGDWGKKLRPLLPFFGSEMAFAVYEENESTASGQLKIADLVDFWSKM